MTQIKKGSEVWIISDWDRIATVCVRRVVVDSFGKKQGTAHFPENGKMIQCHLNPANVGKSLFNVADVADIHALALQIAVEAREARIQHYRNVQHAYADTASQGYHESMRKDCQAVIDAAPRVLFLD